jgi:hypothetical protein
MITKSSIDQWFERCACSLCEQDAREELHALGAFLYRKVLATFSADPALGNPRRNAWSLIESHNAAGRMRDGKTYKLWMRERTDAARKPETRFTTTARLLMRAAVRRLLATESPNSLDVSMDAPVNPHEDPNAQTVTDLLALPQSDLPETERREMDAAVPRIVQSYLDSLSEAERFTIAALDAGIASASEKLMKETGLRKNKQYELRKALRDRLDKTVMQIFPEMDPQGCFYLVTQCMPGLRKKILEMESDRLKSVFGSGLEQE